MAQSLGSLIRRIFWFALALLLILFSVSNRQHVVLALEPFGALSVSVPLYLVLFLGIFVGLLIAGGVTGWLRLKGFARRRKAERRAGYLEDQVSALSEDVHKAHARSAHETVRSATEALPNGGKQG
ncbi:lipopolysaccharide assembly protein LapA domain-containing protein [Kordiimonas lipolytica]|uniref:Lipopolysaccharide assembly protein LapA domain-containing protein n=1 Tax=Kordiimonas lipolytica TaxID=1662421 RepID=A0ABV8UD68_9PROT|nr:lipopolysaccharide assembly protein LapA domain-containing protein [Kordiimonas lipolytica]